MKNFSKNNYSKKVMIPIKGDHIQKIIINLIIFKKIDLIPVKIILMKEAILKKEMMQI